MIHSWTFGEPCRPFGAGEWSRLTYTRVLNRCGTWLQAPRRLFRLPARVFRRNAEFQIFDRRAAFGPRCGRYRSMNFSPAKTCATKHGAAGSPWKIISAVPNQGADTLHWQAFTAPGKFRRSWPRTLIICTTRPALNEYMSYTAI